MDMNGRRRRSGKSSKWNGWARGEEEKEEEDEAMK